MKGKYTMITNLFDIDEIRANYTFKGEYYDFTTLNNGHINNTYLLRFDNDGTEKCYVLQQINTAVFKDPDVLMANYVGVTEFIRKKVEAAGGNPKRESIKVYFTNDGKPYYLDKDGRYWRVINYIINTVSYNFPDNTEICRKAGKTFGNFQKLLADYLAETLAETIPNFHHTVSRYAAFEEAVKADKAGRAASVQKEIEFFVNRKNDCSVLLDLLEMGMMKYPEENGNFPSMSGVIFSVNTALPTSVKTDENGNFTGVDGDYRVYGVKVLDKESGEYRDLELEGKYVFASFDFYLRSFGSGMAMLKDAKLIEDEGTLDIELLEGYITQHLDGVIGEKYAQPSGRIIFTEGYTNQ
jgi:hypothetical protein